MSDNEDEKKVVDFGEEEEEEDRRRGRRSRSRSGESGENSDKSVAEQNYYFYLCLISHRKQGSCTRCS
jgi:hypothetical protein